MIHSVRGLWILLLWLSFLDGASLPTHDCCRTRACVPSTFLSLVSSMCMLLAYQRAEVSGQRRWPRKQHDIQHRTGGTATPHHSPHAQVKASAQQTSSLSRTHLFTLLNLVLQCICCNLQPTFYQHSTRELRRSLQAHRLDIQTRHTPTSLHLPLPLRTCNRRSYEAGMCICEFFRILRTDESRCGSNYDVHRFGARGVVPRTDACCFINIYRIVLLNLLRLLAVCLMGEMYSGAFRCGSTQSLTSSM